MAPPGGNDDDDVSEFWKRDVASAEMVKKQEEFKGRTPVDLKDDIRIKRSKALIKSAQTGEEEVSSDARGA